MARPEPAFDEDGFAIPADDGDVQTGDGQERGDRGDGQQYDEDGFVVPAGADEEPWKFTGDGKDAALGAADAASGGFGGEIGDFLGKWLLDPNEVPESYTIDGKPPVFADGNDRGIRPSDAIREARGTTAGKLGYGATAVATGAAGGAKLGANALKQGLFGAAQSGISEYGDSHDFDKASKSAVVGGGLGYGLSKLFGKLWPGAADDVVPKNGMDDVVVRNDAAHGMLDELGDDPVRGRLAEELRQGANADSAFGEAGTEVADAANDGPARMPLGDPGEWAKNMEAIRAWAEGLPPPKPQASSMDPAEAAQYWDEIRQARGPLLDQVSSAGRSLEDRLGRSVDDIAEGSYGDETMSLGESSDDITGAGQSSMQSTHDPVGDRLRAEAAGNGPIDDDLLREMRAQSQNSRGKIFSSRRVAAPEQPQPTRRSQAPQDPLTVDIPAAQSPATAGPPTRRQAPMMDPVTVPGFGQEATVAAPRQLRGRGAVEPIPESDIPPDALEWFSRSKPQPSPQPNKPVVAPMLRGLMGTAIGNRYGAARDFADAGWNAAGRVAGAIPKPGARSVGAIRSAAMSPDQAAQTWALQSVSASGQAGLPQDEQAKLDSALVNGNDDELSSLSYRLSMKFPTFASAMQGALKGIQGDGE